MNEKIRKNCVLFSNCTRWKALDEIYKIYICLHRSDLNISAKFVVGVPLFFQTVIAAITAWSNANHRECDAAVGHVELVWVVLLVRDL